MTAKGQAQQPTIGSKRSKLLEEIVEKNQQNSEHCHRGQDRQRDRQEKDRQTGERIVMEGNMNGAGENRPPKMTPKIKLSFLPLKTSKPLVGDGGRTGAAAAADEEAGD
jgi:hypothetical protein